LVAVNLGVPDRHVRTVALYSQAIIFMESTAIDQHVIAIDIHAMAVACAHQAAIDAIVMGIDVDELKITAFPVYKHPLVLCMMDLDVPKPDVMRWTIKINAIEDVGRIYREVLKVDVLATVEEENAVIAGGAENHPAWRFPPDDGAGGP
jgi:hypothetical protein